MRAVKGNREYTIDETQQKGYQDMGFDILDEDGKVVAYGRGKTVPYDDHVRALHEIEKLCEKIAELEGAAGQGAEKKAGAKKAGE